MDIFEICIDILMIILVAVMASMALICIVGMWRSFFKSFDKKRNKDEK